MSIPRGFTLVFGDLAAHGWGWRAWSRRATAPPTVVTFVTAHLGPCTLVAIWTDGTWATGWVRHPDDPAPVAIGARALRPLLADVGSAPRWVRPDLDAPREGSKNQTPRGDEGSAPADRWAPEIEARVSAGMNQGRGPAG